MSECVFEKALRSFSNDEEEIIRTKINEWSNSFPYGQRITRNFTREQFLPVNSMKEVLRIILDNEHLDIYELEDLYEKECYNHVLLGGDMDVAVSPSCFGAAIERKQFEYYLGKHYYKYFPNKQEVKEFIESLLSNTTIIGSKYSSFKKIKLKVYNQWSTWNHEDLSKRPFDFANTNEAKEIRANLGLTRIRTSKELLLFVFEIPSTIVPKRPTVADAGLYQYFEPPLRGSGHGWTINWQEEPSFQKKNYNLKSRPEVVHESILLESMLLPIEERL